MEGQVHYFSGTNNDWLGRKRHMINKTYIAVSEDLSYNCVSNYDSNLNSNKCNRLLLILPFLSPKNCQHNTAGEHCERCKEGYYWNTVHASCRVCPCPHSDRYCRGLTVIYKDRKYWVGKKSSFGFFVAVMEKPDLTLWANPIVWWVSRAGEWVVGRNGKGLINGIKFLLEVMRML